MKYLHMKRILLLLFSTLFIINFNAQGGTLYVNSSVAQGGDGSSWESAYNSLQTAIDNASDGDEIWVAAGTYYPEKITLSSGTPTDRDKAFVLPAGVKIYGGFSATGDPTMAERDWETYETILSGNLDYLTDPDDNSNTNNAHHVILALGIDNSAELDGFTIQGGNANLSSNINIGGNIGRNTGAGLFMRSASPTLRNLNFKNNSSNSYGGALSAEANSVLNISEATFHNNNVNSGGYGGAMYLTATTGQMHNIVMSGNGTTSTYGGAISIIGGSNISIQNAEIYGNGRTSTNGGAVYVAGASKMQMSKAKMYNNLSANGGAVYSTNVNTIDMLDVIIYGNSAASAGGGIWLNTNNNTINLTNVTIADNTAGNIANGYGIYISNNVIIKVYNSIIWSDSTTSSDIGGSTTYLTRQYSLVKGFADSSNNNIPGGSPLFNADYTLMPGSPAIDAGSNTLYTNAGGTSSDTDIFGNVRIYNAASNAAGGTIDIGVSEFNALNTITSTTLYVNKNTTVSNGDGSSWENPLKELSDAIGMTKKGAVEKILVAEGTYYPTSSPNGATTARDKAFVLPSGVKIYGGFPADATSATTEADRDPATHVTILSGDLDGGGTMSTTDAYHVVLGINLSAETVLDGFTITRGYSNTSGSITLDGVAIPIESGAGMYLYNSSPTLNNLVFDKNSAYRYGGALYSYNTSSPVITNSIFRNNSNIQNSASYGGAIYKAGNGTMTLRNVLFHDNYAISSSSRGGAIYLNEGILNITNSTFTNNYTNTSTNTSTTTGHAIYRAAGTLNIYNSIIWGNAVGTDVVGAITTQQYSLVRGQNSTANGNIVGTTDPKFKPDYSLYITSPAVDTGLNSLYINAGGEETDIDLAGNSRFWNANQNLAGGNIDMGAYETIGHKDVTLTRLYVNKNIPAEKEGNGSSWDNAIKELSDALMMVTPSVTEIWVAEGTYIPLNKAGNGTTDNDRSFVIPAGVAIYGGFPNPEDLASPANLQLTDRDFVNHKSILSGLLYGNVKAYHVLLAVNIPDDEKTILDGFEVVQGLAALSSSSMVNGYSISHIHGGGMYLHDASPILRNMVFANNGASYYGNAVYIVGSSNPKMYQILMHNNGVGSYSNNRGGAIYLAGGTFSLYNSTLTGNVAYTSSAQNGHGIYVNSGNANIYNSIVWSSNTIADFYKYSTSSIITIENSLIKGINSTDNGNLPGYMNPLLDSDFVPLPYSPVVDAGNNTPILGILDNDLAGNDRRWDAGNGAIGGNVDMGAYELIGTKATPLLIYYM